MSYKKVLSYICAYWTLGYNLLYLLIIFRGFNVISVKHI